MKKCPYCAEEIQDDAIICRFCNRNIQPSNEIDEIRKARRRFNNWFFSLILFSLIFGIGTYILYLADPFMSQEEYQNTLVIAETSLHICLLTEVVRLAKKIKLSLFATVLLGFSVFGLSLITFIILQLCTANYISKTSQGIQTKVESIYSEWVPNIIVISLIFLIGLAISIFSNPATQGNAFQPEKKVIPTLTLGPTDIPKFPTQAPWFYYSAKVKSNSNVREGPGTDYRIISSLPTNSVVTIIEISPDYEWFHISESTNHIVGWINANLLTYDFLKSEIPIVKEVPAKTVYSAPTATSQKSAPKADTTLKIHNYTGGLLKIILSGPIQLEMNLKIDETREIQIPHGIYKYTATFANIADVLSGTKDITIGVYDWDFYITNKQ